MEFFAPPDVTAASMTTAIAAALASLPNKTNARVATTAALAAVTATTQTLTANANGAIAAVDGVTLVADDIVIVKNQAAPAQNGRFTVTQVGVTGVAQVETTTVVTGAGEITGSGDLSVTITSALVTGSPLLVPVAVLATDTETDVADKIRTELAGTSAITDHFTVSGASANVVLTALVAAANDATLNIALANGTATGLTEDATSTNTTAGVAGAPFILTRTSDANTWDELAGMIVKVNEGSTLADHLFQCTNNAGGTLGTTAVTIEDITLKLAAATETAAGIVELSTDAEAITGTDTTRAITPANLTARLGAVGTLAGVTSMTGGASNMTITSGTGNSRTLTLRTTTSGGTATNAIVIDATQRVTISSNEATSGSSSGALVCMGGIGGTGLNVSGNVIGQNAVYGTYLGQVSGGVVQFLGSTAGASATRMTFDFTPSSSTMGIGIGASAITIYRGDGTSGGTLNVTGTLIVATQTPASAAATGTTGTIAWDASFLYVCTATDTWKRAAIATW